MPLAVVELVITGTGAAIVIVRLAAPVPEPLVALSPTIEVPDAEIGRAHV